MDRGDKVDEVHRHLSTSLGGVGGARQGTERGEADAAVSREHRGIKFIKFTVPARADARARTCVRGPAQSAARGSISNTDFGRLIHAALIAHIGNLRHHKKRLLSAAPATAGDTRRNQSWPGRPPVRGEPGPRRIDPLQLYRTTARRHLSPLSDQIPDPRSCRTIMLDSRREQSGHKFD
jgi:hypothetical protein